MRRCRTQSRMSVDIVCRASPGAQSPATDTQAAATDSDYRVQGFDWMGPGSPAGAVSSGHPTGGTRQYGSQPQDGDEPDLTFDEHEAARLDELVARLVGRIELVRVG